MAVTITDIKKTINDTATVREGKETETQEFLITVAETTATPIEIERASGTVGSVTYPAYGAAHTVDTSLLVIGKTAKRAPASKGPPARNVWLVSVEYGTPTNSSPSFPTAGFNNNIRVSVGGAEQTVVTNIQQDENNTPIYNSVGDYYPDPVEITLYDEAISLEFEANFINMDQIAYARGKINDAPISMNIQQGQKTFSRSFAKHTILLKAWDYDAVVSKNDSTVHKWGNRVVLLYRYDTWNKFLPEKGYRWYVDDALTDWKDTPAYLAADGTKLPEGEPLVKTEAIQVYKEANLSVLLNSI